MSIPDDEQLKKYLKQFQPVAPEPLIVKEQIRTRLRPVVVASYAGVAAAILFAVVMSVPIHKPIQPVQDISPKRPGMQEFGNPQPLTIASANALLARAPSYKVAVENMAFQSESQPISEGRYSVLALLSKEEVKQWRRYDSQQ